jgi:hypothetical protein
MGTGGGPPVLKRAVVCTLAVLLTASCSRWAEEAVPFTGTWQSEGYGIYMVVGGDGVRIYEHTSVSCVQVLDASASGADEFMALEDGQLLMKMEEGWGSDMAFDAIEGLPEACSEQFRSDDPSRVLEVLTRSFEEHYAFLDERDPEWEAHVAEAEGKLREGMEPGELLSVIQDLLRGLGDPQVWLFAEEGLIEETIWTASPGSEVADLVGQRIAAGTGLASIDESSDAEAGYLVGRLPGGAGYVGLLQLLSVDVDLAASEEILLGAIDGLIADVEAEGAPGLIIDLRDNYGGLEQLAVAVASRFVADEAVVARHEVRVGGTDEYVDYGEIMVTPNPGGTFEGRVAVLVGPGTEGAAEWLVLALMQSPDVVVVGEPTAGSLSPLFFRGLPNGWSVSVPHQRVYDADGNLWELSGIPPDEEVELTMEHLEAGEDPVVERAVELLSG